MQAALFCNVESFSPVENRPWWADGRILSCATRLQILCHSTACCSFKLIFMKHFYAAPSESFQSWNNGKSGAKLVLTSSTTPGLQIHKFDHSRTANPCDWLPCRRAALPLVGCPHSIVYLHLPVVEGLIFCISATPHLGTSFPLFHASSYLLIKVSREPT